MSRIEKTTFESFRGQTLAAIIDWPDSEPWAYGVYAHCFTCTKDVKAAYFTSRTLAAAGIAVLRFDFSGLGDSEGDFAAATFSSHVEDLVAAARYLDQQHRAPSLLVGHSLGGTAVLAGASQVPSVRAAVTVAAPFDPAHLRRHLGGHQLDRSAETVNVEVAGRNFRLARAFFEELEAHDLQRAIADLGCALLVCHSPEDRVVDIREARRIYDAAAEPRSLVSLPGAGHLLLDREQGAYLGRLIAAWADRYLRAGRPIAG